MTFLSPALLWFSILAGVPLLIHLINRSRLKDIEFPTIDFLMPATKKLLYRFQLLQWLLLLIRIMIILILTMAFARPAWKGYIAGRDVAKNIILIDNSYSMELAFGKSSSLEFTKDIARRLSGELGGYTAVGYFNDGLKKLHPFSNDQDEIIERISAVKPSFFSTDIPAAVNDADELLTSGMSDPGAYNFVILSDFNIDGLPEDREGIVTENIHFMLVDTVPGSSNIWLENAGHEPSYTGLPTTIKAAADSTDASRARMYLNVGGVSKNMKQVELEGSDTITFRHVFSKPGLYPATITVSADSIDNRIKADDTRYFFIQVNPKIRVLIVDGNPGYTLMGGESYFLARALVPGRYQSRVSARIINTSEIDNINTGEYDIIFLLNADLDPGIAGYLERFSRAGKGICIFGGDNVRAGGYNGLLEDLLGIRISDTEAGGPSGKVRMDSSGIFGEYFGGEDLILNAWLKTNSISGSIPAVTAGKYPVVWTDTGMKNGKAAFITTTASLDWSDLPMKTSFPAFINELVNYLAPAKSGKWESLNIGDTYGGTTGARLADKPERQNAENYGIYTEPGNHETDSGINGVSVNLNAAGGESSLVSAGQDDIMEIFPKDDTFFIDYSDDLYADIMKALTGSEKSSVFFIIVLVLLISEEILRKYMQSHEN